MARIRNKGILLRPVRKKDYSLLNSMRHDPDIDKNYYASDVDKDLYFLTDCISENYVIKENNIIKGQLSLYFNENNSCSVSYYVGKEYRNTRVASRALEGIVNKLHVNKNISSITASCYADNVSSTAVLKKNGFRLIKSNDNNGRFIELYLLET